MSKNHGMEMFQKGDSAHLEAMQEMKEQLETPTDMAEWFESKRSEFEDLPED